MVIVFSPSDPFDLTSTFPPLFWPKNIDPYFLVPILLCNALSYILLRALVVQVSYYLRRYKKDSPRTRAVIWAILLANLLHVGVQVSRDIDIFALGFGDWSRLGDIHWKPQVVMLPTLAVLIISFSQTIIATRSYLFCRSLAAGRPSPRERVWCLFKALLILGSLGCGLGAVVVTASYPDLFARGEDNDFRLVGSKAYPLLELLWLCLGTAADLSIAWSMYSDTRKAKTGYQTSSDSVLQVLINVALRCGAVLALTQTIFNILYFTVTPTWAEGALALLPRVSSLTVLYSISSPREAYRAFLRRQEQNQHQPGGRVSLDRRQPTQSDSLPTTTSEGGGRTPSKVSGSSRVRSLKKAVGGLGSKTGARISFLGVGVGKKRSSRRAVDEEQGWIEESGKRRSGEKIEHEMALTEKGSRGSSGGGGGGSTCSAVIVQTTSVVSVERVSEEGRERLGNSVTIEGLNAPSPPPFPRSRSQQNHHLLRLSSTSNLRPASSSRSGNNNQTSSDPHPLRSHSHSHFSPSSPSLPPNFMDSFPSRPTVTSSIGTYDEEEVDEMFNGLERL